MKGRKPGLETMRRRLATRAPTPPPSCPEWLDDDAKAEWGRVVPGLARDGILMDVDGMILASYCQAFSQWKAAVAELKKNGLTYVDGRGNVQVSPIAKHAASMLAEMRRVAIEFGFTPCSRARVDVPPQEDEDDGFFSPGPVGQDQE